MVLIAVLTSVAGSVFLITGVGGYGFDFLTMTWRPSRSSSPTGTRIVGAIMLVIGCVVFWMSGRSDHGGTDE